MSKTNRYLVGMPTTGKTTFCKRGIFCGYSLYDSDEFFGSLLKVVYPKAKDPWVPWLLRTELDFPEFKLNKGMASLVQDHYENLCEGALILTNFNVETEFPRIVRSKEDFIFHYRKRFPEGPLPLWIDNFVIDETDYVLRRDEFIEDSLVNKFLGGYFG